MITKSKLFRLKAIFRNFNDIYGDVYLDFEEYPTDQEIEDWLYVQRAYYKWGSMEVSLSEFTKIKYDNNN